MYFLLGSAIQCVSQAFRFHSAVEQSVFLRQTAAWWLHWNATLHSCADLRKLDECQWHVVLVETWWSLLGREQGHFLAAGKAWCSHSAPEIVSCGNQHLFGPPRLEAHLTGSDNVFCKVRSKKKTIFLKCYCYPAIQIKVSYHSFGRCSVAEETTSSFMLENAYHF